MSSLAAPFTGAKLVLSVALGFTIIGTAGCADRSAERQHEYLRTEGTAVRTLSVRLGEPDRRDRVEVRPGQTLVVRLEGESRQGFRWELKSQEWDRRVLELLERPGIPPETAGAAASASETPTRWDVFNFRAVDPGSATLQFEHVRPLDADGRPTEQYRVTVQVAE